MKKFLTIGQMEASGKVVLLRADLNVPVQDGKVSDTTRIDRLIPTLREILKKGGRLVILSHFGRPKGKKDPTMSLAPIGKALEAALGQTVGFVPDCIGADVEAAIKSLKNGEALLLENVRYYDEEENNDAAFAAKIAALGDIYVNDAFSCAHRAHATTEAIAKLLPAYAGRLMEAELDALEKALGNPERPVCAIVGGSKISTKLDLLGNLVKKVDKLVLGGAMANTFLFSMGVDVGLSLCEKDMADTARQISAAAKAAGCEIILPVDGIVAASLAPHVVCKTVAINKIPADKMVLDIGPKTVAIIESRLKQCKTILWNGPVGAFETKPFDVATLEIAKFVAELTAKGNITSVAGGGDTVSALTCAKVEDRLTYVSAAGGAFLEWLEGKTLPGVAALYESASKS